MIPEQHQQMLNLRLELQRSELTNWLKESFLHWHWWVSLVVFTIPWFFWWKLVDRRRLPWVLSFALMLGLLNCLIDIVCVKIGLYYYPKKMEPIWPGLIMGDLTLPPVVFSLFYQRYRNWIGFLAASLIASAAFSFIGEPLLRSIGMFELYRWSYLYSLPLYMAIAATVKLFIDLVEKSGTASLPPLEKPPN